jgi:hypothetical protein
MSEVQAAGSPITIYGERNPIAPSQLAAFAFSIGEWEGTGKTKLPDGKSAQFFATWKHTGAMPPFGGSALSPANVQAVATYVWGMGHQH